MVWPSNLAIFLTHCVFYYALAMCLYFKHYFKINISKGKGAGEDS